MTDNQDVSHPSAEIEKSEGWINLRFDSQVLNAFMECPRLMDLKFNQHLVPLSGMSSSYGKGSLAHIGLQSYYEDYKEGIDYSNRVSRGLTKMREGAASLGLSPEEALLVYKTFEEYCDYRKADIFNIVGIEQVFAVIIYEVFPIRVILTGRIDLIIQDFGSNELIPYDHKSESESWFYSPLKNQFIIYALACKSQRVVVNRFGFQKTKDAKDKFRREHLAFDAEFLDEWRNETLPYYAKQMILAQEENYYPPNFSACIKGHFCCVFSDKYNNGICNHNKGIRAEKLNRYFIKQEWHPEEI